MKVTRRNMETFAQPGLAIFDLNDGSTYSATSGDYWMHGMDEDLGGDDQELVVSYTELLCPAFDRVAQGQAIGELLSEIIRTDENASPTSPPTVERYLADVARRIDTILNGGSS